MRAYRAILGFTIGAIVGFLFVPTITAINYPDPGQAAQAFGALEAAVSLILGAFGGLIGTIIGAVAGKQHS